MDATCIVFLDPTLPDAIKCRIEQLHVAVRIDLINGLALARADFNTLLLCGASRLVGLPRMASLRRSISSAEQKTEALAMSHDTFSRNTRAQLKQVFDALRELMTPPDPPKRPIGFVTPEDKAKKNQARARGRS